MVRSAIRILVAAAFGIAAVGPAPAAEVVRADGEREAVEELRQDGQGRWLAKRQGRLTVLKPGEFVAVVDDAGRETVLLPEVAEGDAGPMAQAALEQLRDPRNDRWSVAADAAGAQPTRGLLEALGKMARDRSKEMRRRAVAGLLATRTLEGVAAAVEAVLAEKDAALRREGASALLGFLAIVQRAGCAAAVGKGLDDPDAAVRVNFAHLAADGDPKALEVLREDGLRHSDHHFREAAAMELARRGDGSGEKVLVSMLGRDRIPGLEEAGPEAMEAALVREQVAICGYLGDLRTPGARAALEKARKSKRAGVREAATKALEGW